MIDLDEIDRDPWPTYPVNKKDLHVIHDVMTKLIKRLAIMENALSFYSDKANWHVPVFDESRVIIDGGRIARNALNGDDT
jgi:hypothetical protein